METVLDGIYFATVPFFLRHCCACGSAQRFSLWLIRANLPWVIACWCPWLDMVSYVLHLLTLSLPRRRPVQCRSVRAASECMLLNHCSVFIAFLFVCNRHPLASSCTFESLVHAQFEGTFGQMWLHACGIVAQCSWLHILSRALVSRTKKV